MTPSGARFACALGASPRGCFPSFPARFRLHLHLFKILFQAKLISCEKTCRDAYYRINEPIAHAVFDSFRAVVKCDPAARNTNKSHK